MPTYPHPGFLIVNIFIVMSHLSQLMNGIMCFIYSLMSCSLRPEDTMRTVQTLTGLQSPAPYDLGHMHSLPVAGVCLPTSCHNDVLCPSQRSKLCESQIFPFPTVPMLQSQQRDSTPKCTKTSALGCARHLDQGWRRSSPSLRHGLCLSCHIHANLG